METNISIYENITVIFGIAGVVMLAVSFVLYFTFDIKEIISKRLGLKEKKALRQMKASSEDSGRQAKVGRGKGGAPERGSGRPPTDDKEQEQTKQRSIGQDDSTVRLGPAAACDKKFSVAPGGMELEEASDTIVLNEEPTTGVLPENEPAVRDSQFIMVRHIMLIHTDEII